MRDKILRHLKKTTLLTGAVDNSVNKL